MAWNLVFIAAMPGRSPLRFAAFGAGYGLASGCLLLLLVRGSALAPAGGGYGLALLIYLAVLALGSAWLGARLASEFQALEREAWLDPYTGLANRRAGDRALLFEESLARREGSSLALLVIDIDDLKSINDTDGHLAGDRALRALGISLRRTCRRTDVAIRWGGDEFVLLARDTTAAAAMAMARRIQEALGRIAPGVTVSVGVAVSDASPGARPGRLFDVADRALYAAKRSGRGRVELGGARGRRAGEPERPLRDPEGEDHSTMRVLS